MLEDRILNKALELIEEENVKEAYDYILKHKTVIPTPSSQYYNYLYCLAALNNKNNEAIEYLEEAIFEKNYWCRPEVLEDDDLDSIRDTDRFEKCKDASMRKYNEALKTVETVVTWDNKSEEKILLALHGNQQNLNHSKEHWDFLSEKSFQVEYIQSKEIDSCGIFRWDDNGTGPAQLIESIEKIDWDSYEEKVLGGFSAGCNVILRAILKYNLSVSAIILQSPWIPVIDNNLISLIERIKEKNIKILIVCGMKDVDCLERSMIFYNELKTNGISVSSTWVNDLGHEFPEDFKEIVVEFLEK